MSPFSEPLEAERRASAPEEGAIAAQGVQGGVWRDVGAVSEVPLRGARRIGTPAGDVAVFRTGEGKLYALLDRCPHKGGPLSRGIVHGAAVSCPLHNLSVDLASGRALGVDQGLGCAPVFPVRSEEGRILLRLDALG